MRYRLKQQRKGVMLGTEEQLMLINPVSGGSDPKRKVTGSSHRKHMLNHTGQTCPQVVWFFTTPWTVVHGILQARILEWVAFPFSRGSSHPRDRTQVSHIAGRFFISWATREAQEHWSGWPIPSPGDCPDPGIELGSLASQADSLPTELKGKPQNNKER